MTSFLDAFAMCAHVPFDCTGNADPANAPRSKLLAGQTSIWRRESGVLAFLRLLSRFPLAISGSVSVRMRLWWRADSVQADLPLGTS